MDNFYYKNIYINKKLIKSKEMVNENLIKINCPYCH